jgi:hypothetical protein
MSTTDKDILMQLYITRGFANWRSGLLGLFSLFCAAVQAVTITGVPNSHDPAGLIKDGDTYFHFTTGQGFFHQAGPAGSIALYLVLLVHFGRLT